MKSICITVMLIVLIEHCFPAQVLHTISFQGVLTDAQVNLIPYGNHTLTLNHSDNVASPTQIFTEAQIVPVVKDNVNAINKSVTLLQSGNHRSSALAGDAFPKSLLSPTPTVSVGQPVNVSFIIANSGNDPVLNISGTADIFRSADGFSEYRSTFTIGILPPNSEDTIRLIPQWTPGSVGGYEVSIGFFATNDGNLSNNQKRFPVQVVAQLPIAKNSSANIISSGLGADPVNLFTGEYFRSERPDIVIDGPLPLVFSRYYASMVKSDNNITSALGDNWLHTYDWKFTRSGSDITIVTNRGRQLLFQKSGSEWLRVNSDDMPFDLEEVSGEFLLLSHENRMIYRFASDRLVNIEDGKGNALSLTYSSGKLVSVSDGFGRALTFSYDTNSRLSSVSDGTRTIQFTSVGNTLTSVTDARGFIWVYNYSGGALMTGSVAPEGNTLYSQTYDQQNRVVSQKDAFDNTTTISYPVMPGGATTLTDPIGNSLTQTHDTVGLLSKYVDENGNEIDLTYDGSGRLQTIRDRFDDETKRMYHHESGYIASITNAANHTTTFTYGKRTVSGLDFYDLTSINLPDGKSISYTYDAVGNRISTTDQRGKTTTYTYNMRGQVLTATNSVGAVTAFTYHADGMPASVVDHAGNTTTFTYDGWKRLTQVTHPDASTRKYSYDANDNLLTMTDEVGQVTTYSYDNNNRLTSVQNALGNTTTFGYDAMDRVTTITDAVGKQSTVSYDPLGRIKSLTDRTGNTTTYAYDKRGNLNAVTDATGKTWQQSVDTESIPTSATDPLGHTSIFSSSKLGRIDRITSPLSRTTTLSYDPMQRLTEITDPLNQTTAFRYDERGNVIRFALPGDSIVTEFTRSDLGQPTVIQDPRRKNLSMQYDAMGRLLSVSDPLGQATQYEYDNRNRVKKVTFPAGLGSLNLLYNELNQPTRKTYSDGTTIEYAYDNLGRLTSATGVTFTYDQNNRLAGSNGITIERDHQGRITGMTYAQNKKIAYAYDTRGLLSEITDWLNGKTAYQYDDAARLTAMTLPNGVTTTYQYDNDNRLISMQIGSLGSISLTRDAIGKIVSAHRSLPLQPTAKRMSREFLYDDASQISSFMHDAVGNTTVQGTRSLSWDLAGRMTSRTDSGETITYTYDAFGLRTGRSTSSSTQNVVWNYATGLPSPAVLRNGSADKSYNIFEPSGMLLYRINASDNVRTYYHFDEMGNTVFTTGESSNVTASFAYSPYGEMLGMNGGDDEMFTYQGQYGIMRDSDDGLYYIRARYYDAKIGRFLSRDPVRSTNPHGVNPYQYAYENPLRYVDGDGALVSEPFSPTLTNDELYGGLQGCRLWGVPLYLIPGIPIYPLTPEMEDDFSDESNPPGRKDFIDWKNDILASVNIGSGNLPASIASGRAANLGEKRLSGGIAAIRTTLHTGYFGGRVFAALLPSGAQPVGPWPGDVDNRGIGNYTDRKSTLNDYFPPYIWSGKIDMAGTIHIDDQPPFIDPGIIRGDIGKMIKYTQRLIEVLYAWNALRLKRLLWIHDPEAIIY